jgi:hypothetical protein
MRDIEIISKALLDANAELTRHRVWPPVNSDATLRRLDQILNHPDVKAAQERLEKGFGLRVVK